MKENEQINETGWTRKSEISFFIYIRLNVLFDHKFKQSFGRHNGNRPSRVISTLDWKFFVREDRVSSPGVARYLVWMRVRSLIL